MRLKFDPERQRETRQAGFSMVEMLVVIGIIGILVGFGAVSYVTQLSESRIDAGIQILNANFKQARQSAISMRQNRRVAIDAGLITKSAFDPDSGLSGQRIESVQIWIEGKRCEEYPFDTNAYCLPGGGAEPNAYPLTDPETFPSGIVVADVDGAVPGVGSNPRVFYIEFNARGSIEKVYFDGMEATTDYNEIAAVIHLTRISETFKIGTKTGDYIDMSSDFLDSELAFSDPPTEESKERYKVQTIEIVRLTGKTRTYDYAIMNPWPIDEFVKENVK